MAGTSTFPGARPAARDLRAAVGVIGYGKGIRIADRQQADEEAHPAGSMLGMALRDGKKIRPHAA